MSLDSPDFGASSFLHVRRAVLVVDVVDSVRQMRTDETAAVLRWRDFMRDATLTVLPRHHGRLVKSLGDGLLGCFDEASAAACCARDLHELARRLNAEQPGDEGFALRLRAGVHVSELFVDEIDVWGAGVNLTARLAAVAEPGQTVLSEEARDDAARGLDEEFVDLGRVYLKGLDEAVRVFATGVAGAASPWPADGDTGVPTVAVLPLSVVGLSDGQRVLGQALADELIAQLSTSPSLRVLSLRSTTRLPRDDSRVQAARLRLGADFVLQGSLRASGARARMVVTLQDAHTQQVVWSEPFDSTVHRFMLGMDELAGSVVQRVVGALALRAAETIRHASLPSLQAHALQLGAIGLMHGNSVRDFERARQALEHLAARLRHLPTPQAWLATWHVLRVVRGWSDDVQRDADQATRSAAQALHADDQHALALTMHGLVLGFLHRDLDAAERLYRQALQRNPSEPFAWLFLGSLRAWQERGKEAVEAVGRAARLSPLDPLLHYHRSVQSFALLACDDYAGAAAVARRSLVENRLHTATHRTLVVALALTGHMDEARRVAAELMTLEPGFTTSAYLRRYPGGDTERARRYAEALRLAGVPETA
jgi:class 3 adenylate cyclase/tetratricopeptide (TPR) repeat protein